MSVDAMPAAPSHPRLRFRIDARLGGRLAPWSSWAALATVLALGVAFVVLGGGNLDLDRTEARLGLAAGSGLGPLGVAFGGWDPSLWPAKVLPSWLWARGEDGVPTPNSVRWPAALAGLALGLLLAQRAARTLGTLAAVGVGLAWFGTLALIDRSAGLGIDLIVGAGTIAALDRMLSRGTDWVAGLWASLAFLAGGWPPLALIVLTSIVLGRSGATLSWRLAVPVLVTVALWSAWALAVVPAEVWAGALTLPLTQKGAALDLLRGVGLGGLPCLPLAALTLAPAVRAGWPTAGRALVSGWLTVAGASAVIGAMIPGLAAAAIPPALAGLAIAAGACGGRIWSGWPELPRGTARAAVGLAVSLIGSAALVAGAGYVLVHPGPRSTVPIPLLGLLAVVGWMTASTFVLRHAPRQATLAVALPIVVGGSALVAAAGVFLALTIGFYRPVAILLVVGSVLTAALTISAAARGRGWGTLAGTVALAVFLKVAHWGVYIPEWNYRFSQGPWGRAIGQWVPPYWPIFTLHPWPADLAFATGHPFLQLDDPRFLRYAPSPDPKYVLLHPEEYKHWPDSAPKLIKVFAFQDQRGLGVARVLARTEGALIWERPDEGEETLSR